MQFTKYGKAMAQAEPNMPNPDNATGATLHALACGYDVGARILLTGTNTYGKRFRREAKSVYGAYATAHAIWGINSAWHVRDDGTRKLVFRR